jgi:hypothetical protein
LRQARADWGDRLDRALLSQIRGSSRRIRGLGESPKQNVEAERLSCRFGRIAQKSPAVALRNTGRLGQRGGSDRRSVLTETEENVAIRNVVGATLTDRGVNRPVGRIGIVASSAKLGRFRSCVFENGHKARNFGVTSGAYKKSPARPKNEGSLSGPAGVCLGPLAIIPAAVPVIAVMTVVLHRYHYLSARHSRLGLPNTQD